MQALRRREREFEQEMQRLARAKITAQERICGLKRDLSQMNIEIDLNHWMSSQDRDSDSTSTATGKNTYSEDPPPKVTCFSNQLAIMGKLISGLTLPMLRLLSSKAKECKILEKPSKPCRLGIHLKALA